MEAIINELNLHDSWYNALRVISTRLTSHIAPLIFGPVATTPETVGLPYYMKMKKIVDDKQVTDAELSSTEFRKKKMEDLWPGVFTMKLLEFFQARLLGPFDDKTAYCDKSRKYCNIFLDIVGEANRENGFRFITGNFFLMMKEYIRHRLPGKRLGSNVDFVKVLKKCRTRYRNANPEHKYYIDFEECTYAKGILELLDELATANAWSTLPHCEYFILASEYLNALSIYLYMIEFCIYCENLSNNSKKFTFFAALEKHIFDFGKKKKDKPAPLTIERKEDIPSDTRAYLKDETTGKYYTIPGTGDWTIGRKSDTHPDIDIRIETDDLCISRNHARLTLKQNPFRKYVLTICDDYDRINTTFVWRIPLSNKFNMQLFNEDKILLGETVFTVYIKY